MTATSPVPTDTSFAIVRGQAVDIEVTVPDGVDLGAATEIGFGFAPSETEAYTDELSTSFSGQVITAVLPGSVSVDMAKPSYFFSCWVVIGGDATPVARGRMRIVNDARNR